MSWLDALKKEVGDFKLSTGEKIKLPKAVVHPRDKVIKLINDNISYINDNSYTIKTAKGETKKPESCFEKADGKASVWLSYSRQKLMLDGENSMITGLDENKVLAALDHLKNVVASGIFDDQLQDIKQKRSAAQKASKEKTAKK